MFSIQNVVKATHYQRDIEYGASTIMFIIWDFLIVKQIFLSPQVKQSVIMSNKLVYTSCQNLIVL